MTMDQFIDLVTAFAPYVWPVFAVVVLFVLRPSIKSLLSRGNFKIKIGGVELSGVEATQSLTALVGDLQEKVAKIEQKISKESTAEGVAEHLQLPVRRGVKPRILWVDDVPASIAIQVQKFMNDGFWVDIAPETAQGLSMFEFTKYDLVISDMGRTENKIYKPDAGIIFAKEVRQRDQAVPIIILTTHDNVARFHDAANRVGVTDITNSPVDLYRMVAELFPGKVNEN